MTPSKSAGDGTATSDIEARLTLADWRRRVSALYASVRERATADPRAAWEHWRTVRDDLYRTHPQSPVPAGSRATHEGRYWPYDPALRFEVEVSTGDPDHDDSRQPDGGLGANIGINLPMSTGDAIAFTRIGGVVLPFQSGPRTLGLFWMAGYAGGLFLPFGDTTNGSGTYGAGRYLLDAAKSADLGAAGSSDRLILDFNFAFQPSCAFDPKWACPLAPPENRLDIPIEAGERIG